MRKIELHNFEDEVRLMKDYSLLYYTTGYIFYKEKYKSSNLLIFKNNKTNELFKTNTNTYYYDINDMKKIFVDFSNYNSIYNKLSYTVGGELRPIVFKYYDPEYLSNGSAIKTFCDKIIHKACGETKLSTDYSLQIKEFLNSENHVYFDEFCNYNKNAENVIMDQYKEKIGSIIRNPKYSKYFDALYLIYLKDSPFSGKYKITKEKLSDTKSNNVFDIIRLSFTMSPNRKRVLDYVKNDQNFKENIVRPIFEYHVGKYANFMRVYDLVLTNSNELVFSFCFKEKAEQLLSGESK